MDKKRAWFIAILFFSGLCLTLYPFVSNLIAQSHASQAIAAYDEQVAEMDQEQIDAADAEYADTYGQNRACLNALQSCVLDWLEDHATVS